MEKNNWDAKRYQKEGSFVSKMAMGVVELLDPQKDEKIFDVGCGEGELATEIQKYGAVVFGIDMSQDMVLSAKDKGIDAKVEDILQIQYANVFDAVFSNAVLHWVGKPEIVAKNIYQALKENGRFVGEFGGYGNCGSVVESIQEVFSEHPEFGEFNNPWYFPKADEYKEVLQSNGFDVKYCEIIPRDTPVKDIKTWLDLFANGIIKDLDESQKEYFKNQVQKKVKSKLYDTTNGWFVDYVRIRFNAVKRD
jgi:SAM-dependent methyltransferase